MNLLKRSAAALAATVGLVALPAAAHAGVIVQFSTDGGATFTTICSSASNNCQGSATAFAGQLTISIAGITSNATGSPASSDIFTAATQVQNLDGVVRNVVLRYGGDGFVMPTSGTLRSNVSGTGTGNAANTVSFVSCAVAGGVAAPNVPCPGGIQAPTLSPNVTGTNFSATSTVNVPTIGTPYLLGEQLTLAIGGGSTINFSNSTDLVAAPEPASIVLMATGLVGLVGFVRRRSSQV